MKNINIIKRNKEKTYIYIVTLAKTRQHYRRLSEIAQQRRNATFLKNTLLQLEYKLLQREL